jgi:hypothetical protein
MNNQHHKNRCRKTDRLNYPKLKPVIDERQYGHKILHFHFKEVAVENTFLPAA